MDNFFAELKRRHVYRVAAAYAVVAWVLVQLVNNLAPIFELPAWIARAVVLLLILGFPVTSLIAWMSHLAPADGATTRAAASKLDWALMGALIVVIALVSYQQLAPATGVKTAQQASAAPAPSQPQPGGISVAVLPFANLSGDMSQEFFSDGMTEEIMTALAKVSALRVVGRESAFQFKDRKTDMKAVGQALNAAYLIEGSVRKEGARVRITAQLVQADNGVSLWTDSYDRELTSVFATQSDIAQAIAGALRVPLGLKPGDSLVTNRTVDLDSYQQYLRGKSLYRAVSIDEATAVLEGVVARDPSFAPAWAILSLAYLYSPRFEGATQRRPGSLEDARRLIQSSQNKAEMAARRAVQLDPKNATGYGALATLAHDRGKWAEAEDLFRQAQALDANDSEVLDRYASLLSSTGRRKEAFNAIERLRNLEPLVPVYLIRYASRLRVTGQIATSISLLEAIPDDPSLSFARNPALAQAYAEMGRFAEAADLLFAIKGDRFTRQSIEDAARLLRQAPMKTKAPEKLPLLEGELAFVNFYVGAPERILDQPEYRFEIGLSNFDSSVWDSKYASVHKGERFRTLARKVGLVDYWRARGWPDLCRPMGADDFVCD